MNIHIQMYKSKYMASWIRSLLKFLITRKILRWKIYYMLHTYRKPTYGILSYWKIDCSSVNTLKWIKVNVDPHDLLQSVLRKHPKFIIISVPIPFVYRGGKSISSSLNSKTSSMEFAINQLIADLHYLHLQSWTLAKAWFPYLSWDIYDLLRLLIMH